MSARAGDASPVRSARPLVLLVAQPPDGGVHRHVAQLAPGLVDRGWRVVVAGPESYAGLGPGVEHVALDMIRPIDPRADAAALAALHAIVRAHRPALVHAHSAKAGALARALKPVLGRRPVVYSPHGYAHAGYFTSPAMRRAYRLVELALAPATARVVCACEAERRIATGVVASSRTRVAHNGVELPGPGPTDAGAAAAARRGPVISVIAGLRAGKGVETAVQALALLHRRHPRAQLAVAGDGPEREAIERLAAAEGVAGDVHLLGSMADPATLLRAATVHLSASWAESFPFAVLEGMAAGLPLVATDVGGTREAVQEGVTGSLVTAQDPAGPAAAIADLLDDAALRAAYGDAGRVRIATRFTVDAMVDAVQSAYGELLPAA